MIRPQLVTRLIFGLTLMFCVFGVRSASCQIEKISFYLSSSECPQCNTYSNEIIRKANECGISLSFYTDTRLNFLKDEIFREIQGKEKLRYTKERIDRSFVEVQYQSGVIEKLDLFLLTDKWLSKVFDNNISVSFEGSHKWKSNTSVFPFKEVHFVTPEVLVGLRYFSNTDLGLLFLDSGLQDFKLMNRLTADNDFLIFLYQGANNFLVSNLRVLNLNKQRDSVLEVLLAIELIDSANQANPITKYVSVKFMLNNFDFVLLSYNFIPYNLFELGGIQFFSKNYNDLVRLGDSIWIGTYYCATDDINADNYDSLKDIGYNPTSVYILDTKANTLTIPNIPLPDSAIWNLSLYYNTYFELTEQDNMVYVIEKSTNRLYEYSVLENKVKNQYTVSDDSLELYLGSYKTFSRNYWRLITLRSLNADRISMVIQIDGKYYLTIYSLSHRSFLYKKELQFRNPSFDLGESYLAVHAIKGFRLRKQYFARFVIKEFYPNRL